MPASKAERYLADMTYGRCSGLSANDMAKLTKPDASITRSQQPTSLADGFAGWLMAACWPAAVAADCDRRESAYVPTGWRDVGPGFSWQYPLVLFYSAIAITSVPLTTTCCDTGIVPWQQQQRWRCRPSLTSAAADRGWRRWRLASYGWAGAGYRADWPRRTDGLKSLLSWPAEKLRS